MTEDRVVAEAPKAGTVTSVLGKRGRLVTE